VGALNQKREIDQLDRIILKTLQQDGRTPFTQIAKQTGVSETTIRSRYQSMVEDGVIRTVGMVDPYALGYQAPALLKYPGGGDKKRSSCSRNRIIFLKYGTSDDFRIF
jgi:DNA-binding Lrp family transcriptional regulator